MAWAKNGTPDTLGSSGDVLDIADMTAKKFNVFLSHVFETGANITNTGTFDGITTSTYTHRYSWEGGADATATSQANFRYGEGGSADDEFNISYGVNISGEEKLIIGFHVGRNTAGAATAPHRQEIVAKATQSAQYTQLEITNSNSGSMDTSSNLSALGTD